MKITFPNNQTYTTDQVEVSLFEVCRTIHAPVVFGCRVGMCGTCKVVVSNINSVSPKNEFEIDFTELPNERLACQCSIRGDVYVEQPKRPV